jgi:hypothetical protein
MDVKEAIAFLESIKWRFPEAGYPFPFDTDQKILKVISLLQELEKYKEIVNEIYTKYWHLSFMEGNRESTLGDEIYKIRGKYFPQPVKKVITIEVEGGCEESFTARFEYYLGEIKKYARGNTKVNIKEVTDD